MPELFAPSFRKLVYALAEGRLASPRANQAGRQSLHALQRGHEPSQSRPYVSGDDPRSFDWPAIARLDGLYVRQREPENLGTSVVVVDTSASMGGGGNNKRVAAWHLALLWAATQVRLRRVVIGGLASQLEVSKAVDLGLAMDRIAAQANTGGEAEMKLPRADGLLALLLVSDFLFDPQQLRRMLGQTPAPTRRLLAVEVLSRKERSPDPLGPSRLLDAETNATLALRVDRAACEAYRVQFSRHEAALSRVVHLMRGSLYHCEADADHETLVQLALAMGTK